MPVLAIGQKFERYCVTRLLGSGVSGESYEAEDTVLHRKVRLKLIHPWSRLSDAARRQFFRSMQGSSILAHPTIIPILNYGEADGQLYIAYHYIGPGSLLGSAGRQWYQPPLTIMQATTYIGYLARTLLFIHNHGFIHGALTLANILVSRSPQDSEATAKRKQNPGPFLLTDIGIAQFVRRFGRPESAFLPITAAPEQTKGRNVAASDQYALAVLLYFWLAGRPPFLGSPEEVAQLKQQEMFPLLSGLNAQVTLEQEGILRRAMSVYPEDRYPSVLAFAEALQLSLPRSTQTPPPPEPKPQIEPEPPQPRPGTQPIPQPLPPQPQPAEPTPLAPEPELPQEPEVIPPPAPDIALPLPDPTPVPAPQVPTTSPEPEPAPAPAPAPEAPPSPSEPAPAPEAPPSPPEPKPQKADDATAEAIATPSEPPVQPAAYVIITSPYTQDARQVSLEGTETTLGRAGSSDILLEEDTLTSRHHALLKREDEHYVIYDQRSTHGVTVNGEKLASEVGHILADGDYIGIGEYELVFHLQPVQDTVSTGA